MSTPDPDAAAFRALVDARAAAPRLADRVRSSAWPTSAGAGRATKQRAPARGLPQRRARAHAHEFLRLRSELSHRPPSLRLPHAARLDAAASGAAPPRGCMRAGAGERMSAALERCRRGSSAPALGAALAHRRPRAGRRLPAVRLSPRAPLSSSPAGCATAAVRSRSTPRARRSGCGLFGDALLSRAPPAAAPQLLDARPALLEAQRRVSNPARAPGDGSSRIHVPRGPVHLR